VVFKDLVTDYFQPVERVRQPITPLSPDEVEQTLSPEAAEKEFARCFNCGICNECDNCRVFCPEVAVIADEHREINLKYCKGCGICVTECPRNAMSLEEEVA
jgi:Pyruvate/2-oxoacid:ferredoxin oxidoreductase delta subunit